MRIHELDDICIWYLYDCCEYPRHIRQNKSEKQPYMNLVPQAPHFPGKKYQQFPKFDKNMNVTRTCSLIDSPERKEYGKSCK